MGDVAIGRLPQQVAGEDLPGGDPAFVEVPDDLGSAERARIAAELLLDRIDTPGRDPRVVGVEPRLVVRASSGVPS